MSYIRPLSNPEALYIIGAKISGREYVQILGSREDPERYYNIPRKVFEGLFLKWLREHRPDDVSYRGLRLRDNPEKEFKLTLSYKDWEITAYETTWYYIASHIDTRQEKW